MKRLLLVLACGCLWAPSSAYAQAAGWDASLFIDPFPSPYLDDWEMNPTLASLTVTNGTGRDEEVTVRLSIADGSGREVVRSRSDPRLIPAGAPTTFDTGSSLTGTSSYDASIEDVIARTGRFPEGDYTVCVTVTDGNGFVLVDNVCEFFSTIFPDPPYLLFPMDGDTVRTEDPIFEWTPVQVPPALETRYVVQVAELLPGQEPHTALTSGILHFEGVSPFSPSLSYPLGAIPLEHGTRYAWWVQALDPNGLPLSTNQGRSEIWTFTYREEGGDDGGEQIGSSLHGRIVPAGPSVDGPLADLGTASFEGIRDALEELPDREIPIPLPISDIGDFEALSLSNVSVDVDEVGRAIAITATASLPMGSVDVLLLGQWEGDGPGTFALGLEPLIFDLGEWIDGVEGTALEELDWSGGILTIADEARTLDGASLPQSVEGFYGVPTVELEVGVSVSHVFDLTGTTLHDRLAEAGLEVSEAELAGNLGVEPGVLFGPPEERAAPSLDLTATLRGARLADTPEWLQAQAYALRVTNDPELAARAELEAEAALGGETFPFLFALDLTEEDDAPPVLTGRMASAWDAPFGMEWLTLDSVRLTVTPPDAEDGAPRAVLEGDLAMGERTARLSGVLDGTGEQVEATFTASVEELALADLLAFAESTVGAVPLGDQLPADASALRDVAVEVRSGDPPTLTVRGTVPFPGDGTDFLYTLVPPSLTGEESARSLVGLRLADSSLGDLVPELQGGPVGDFSFPELSLVWGPEGDPVPPEGGEEGDGGRDQADAAWSIAWPDLSGPARGFFASTYPCAEEGAACAAEPASSPSDDASGAQAGGDGSSLDLQPGLNLSAPFSLAELSSGVRELLDFGTGGTGSGDGPDAAGTEEPAERPVLRGAPGISLGSLLDGAPDLSGLLSLRASLPPLPDGAMGLPDWITPASRSIRVVEDPEVRVMAEAVVDADLDGRKRFHLATDLTNAEGGGAVFEGLMEGGWDQPFGLTWLALDSVHMALGVGSVGARVQLGSNLEVGSVTGALDMDVRGSEGDRSVDFTARVADLATTDAVDFLNDAFDAGLATPGSPVALDSLQVDFSTGDAEAFHIAGAFSSGMDADEALQALSELLPGYTAPAEMPFELGTLDDAWFELHVVADSVWGGYGGRVAVGDDAELAPLEGTAAVRLGAPRPSGDAWVALELDLSGRDLESDAVLATLSSAVPAEWALPEGLESVGTVVLDSARARVEMDSRAELVSAELTGAGQFDGEAGELEADVELGLSVEEEESLAQGQMLLDLRDTPMSEALAEAASVLPGEWTLPADLDAMTSVRLDSAALALGFDSRTDSLSADVRGTGTMDDETDDLRASAELTLVRTAADEWAAGGLEIDVGALSLPDALARAEELLDTEWQLPDATSGLTALMLDEAILGVAFDSRTPTFLTDITGAGHLGEGPDRMDGSVDLSLVDSDGERFARGGVTLAVEDLALTGVLDEVAALLPGGWALPDDFTAFDALHLDEAELAVGFDTRTDSLSAHTLGSGTLETDASALAATSDITFLRLGEESRAVGTVEIGRESVTMAEALGQITEMLPGSWALPDGLDAFESVALDRADFRLGFDTRSDSIHAAVSGAGGYDGLDADARLDFLRRSDDDRVTGLLTLDAGSVGAGQAIDRISGLLPGDWGLPDGFDSFDALTLDDASLETGFDTGADSLWAGFEGEGRLDDVTGRARLGFVRVGETNSGSGLVSLGLGDVSLDEAFGRATGLLPGDWPAPDVDFPIGDLRDVDLQLGFDTRADSVWAGVDALARLADRDGEATLTALSVGGASGTARSWAEGSFRVDVGDVTLPEALDLAAGLVPGTPQVPELEFDLGGIRDAVLEAGFRTGENASARAGLIGGFDMGSRTARAEVGLELGASSPQGYFRAAFDESFGVSDAVELMRGFVPAAGVELPPLGPLDVSIENPRLTLNLGERTGVSLGGATELFGRSSDALFAFSRIDGQPQLVLGVQVPDLGFADLVPELENPITDEIRLDLAALTITRGEGTVSSDDLTPEERAFYRPLFGGGGGSGGPDGGDGASGGEGAGADFDVDLRPGLNLTGLVPLADAGALKEMVDMLTPGASDLTLTGSLPLPGFGAGGIRDLSLRGALPPMAPPGSPAWFVEGQVGLEISGRPSVGLGGDMTVDVDGDTLTFDIESNVAVVPQGVELSIAGGLTAENPWVGPMGVDWLTLNEIRLAMGLNPLSVRLGFLGDAVIGTQDIRMALGTRINIYTGVPTGALVLGETNEGLTLSDLMEFQQSVAGEGAEPISTDAVPDMALRELGIRVATYTDFDLGIEAGIGLRGAFLLQTGTGGELSEFGRVDLSVDREGILGDAELSAFSLGPVAFDEALLDLALTREEQHLVIEGGALIDNSLESDVALAMSRDSLRFATDFDLFDQFRAEMNARAGFELTDPNFTVRAALYPEFSDELTYEVGRQLVPASRQALETASARLDDAEAALERAESNLDDAIWVASQASREAMDRTYALYRTSARSFSAANSRYRYHAARCSWRSPGHCGARNYWRGIRAARLGQRNARWAAYTAARAVYQNREYLENNPAVNTARATMDEARVTFNQVRAEVDQLETTLASMQEWMESYEACASCDRPSLPVQVTSAEAEAALEGFFGRSQVDLAVGYRVFGDRAVEQVTFGGSMSELSQALYNAISDALF